MFSLISKYTKFLQHKCMETNHYVYINYWSHVYKWTFIQYRYSKNESKKVGDDFQLCKKTIISGLQRGKCCKYVENGLFNIEMEAL